ncbi:splicing factor YJU2-like isoform X1 [Diachasmimorpha longicaudata]|uniref:splicing factor YJU2-like isoform X1 n=1 Tax=Diachasmimorpha longicaudata TaxID=58733 RepID=UPI0030B87391
MSLGLINRDLSERSEKYYPPDFDPSKIPRMELAKNRQYTVRLMAPFNMRCKTCGEYIYKGKKFNARKEDVDGDDYLGIRIYRFYIKCTRCLQEISFKTDPKNTDYEIEAGATRNFMALKLAEEQAQREEDEEKEEEAINPMKLLEKRIHQCKQELELLESLEELKDLNWRQQRFNYDEMLEQYNTAIARQRTIKEQEKLDEELVQSIFSKKRLIGHVLEEEIIELDDPDDPSIRPKRLHSSDELTTTVNSGETSDGKASSMIQGDMTKPSTLTSSSVGEGTSLSWSAVSTAPQNRSEQLIKKKTCLGIVAGRHDNKDLKPLTSPNRQNDNSSNSHSVDGISTNGLALLGAYSEGSDDCSSEIS